MAVHMINNLSGLIKEIEELILASSGSDPFEEILKIISIKLYSEKNGISVDDPYDIFSHVKKEWPGIFPDNSQLELSKPVENLCLKQLGNVRLENSNLQIVDAAFEYMLPKKAKGSRGQYFTPRYIIDEIIKILNPKMGEKVIDPACGSGGFLLHSASYMKTDNCIYGIDFDNQMQRIAKILMMLSGYENIKIVNANALNGALNDDMETNFFDVVMTNPPFGGEISDISILKNYELALEKSGRTKRVAERHILFIEKIINLLKPGGRACIVVPQGILNNTNLNYIREWIYRKCRVLGVISLDTNTFKPFTNVKTSLLFLQKWQDKPLDDYKVFMGVSKKSGKNLSGNLSYKMRNGMRIIDSDLTNIAVMLRQFMKEEKVGF